MAKPTLNLWDVSLVDQHELLRTKGYPSLEPIVRSRNYVVRLGDNQIWLEWGPESPKGYEDVFSEVFKSMPTLSYTPGKAYPVAEFLTQRTSNKRRREILAELTKQVIDEKSRLVNRNHIPILMAEHELYLSQVCRDSERISEPLDGIRRVLQVCLFEVEHETSAGRSHMEQPRDGFSLLWHYISRGVGPVERLKWIDRVFLWIYGIDDLIEVQRQGVLHYAEQLDQILEEAAFNNVKRNVLEYLLQAARQETPLLESDVKQSAGEHGRWAEILKKHIPTLRQRSQTLLMSRLRQIASLLVDDHFKFGENTVLYRKLEQDEFAASQRMKEHKTKRPGETMKTFFSRHLKACGIGLLHGDVDFLELAKAFRLYENTRQGRHGTE